MNELWIYDVIGQDLLGEGVTAKTVRDELKAFDDDMPILLRLNSPGGSVFDGVAIKTLLDAWEPGVHVQVDGIAASAASYLAMVGQTIVMAKGAMLMIHEPWSVVVGNAADMEKEAALLRKVGGQLAEAYAAKSGASLDDIRLAMADETWYTADEAVGAGFADAVLESPAKAFTVPPAFGYRHAPQTQSAAPARNRVAALQRRLSLTRAQFRA